MSKPSSLWGRMSLIRTVCGYAAMSMYVGSLMFMAAGSFISCLALCWGHYKLPALFFASMALLVYLPLETPQWGKRLSRFAMASYGKRVNFRVVYEDANTFSRDQACVIGYEPHSVFPFGIPQVFSDVGLHRANLQSVSVLATSVVNWCPIIRHLFHWLNGVSASRANMRRILDAGGSVIVVPGGVAECAYMEPGKDIAFLKSRKGFVKIALQHGAPLVPVYCFGQSDAYRFIRLWPPFLPQWLYDKIVRSLLFCPMLIYGYYGSPLPNRNKLYMVIGRPIITPHLPDPDPEEVEKYLQIFIEAMQGIYQRHQRKAGYPGSKLVVM